MKVCGYFFQSGRPRDQVLQLDVRKEVDEEYERVIRWSEEADIAGWGRAKILF